MRPFSMTAEECHARLCQRPSRRRLAFLSVNISVGEGTGVNDSLLLISLIFITLNDFRCRDLGGGKRPSVEEIPEVEILNSILSRSRRSNTKEFLETNFGSRLLGPSRLSTLFWSAKISVLRNLASKTATIHTRKTYFLLLHLNKVHAD